MDMSGYFHRQEAQLSVPPAVCRGRRHPYDDHLHPGACDGASVPVLKASTASLPMSVRIT